MEFESYTDEELWRTADPGETYLDPPIFTKKQKKEQEKKTRKNRQKDVEGKVGERLTSGGANKEGNDTDSIDSSDSEYDEKYQENIRKLYMSRQSWVRDRDFARKYSLSTMDIVSRYVSNISATGLLQDNSAIPSLLTRLFFDDIWQLLAELRIMQDHIDSDLGADLHLHLLEDIGTVTRQNMAWIRSTLQELSEWIDHVKTSRKTLDLSEDLEQEMVELQEDLQSLRSRSEQTFNFLVASTGITQSALVIDQTSGINKLTELAFFFVPLSFITAVFSMQVAELNDAPPKMWTWGLSLGVVFIVTYTIRIFLRSPTVKYYVKTSRVTILNRFTPKSRSMSLRLDSISNRAIAKFLFFFITTMSLILMICIVYLLALFLVFFGIWAGIAGTALYFIITRWPEAAVLAPCFVALVLSGAGLLAVWHWGDYLEDPSLRWMENCLELVKNLWPEEWITDAVDDEDLDREGVPTYARQGIFFPSK
jgi:Mg2+ and Co2+ transporter CorA